MDRITKLDLNNLLAHPSGPRLSLTMPTHRMGSEIQQDPIRFKNLLEGAEDRLCDRGLRRPEAKDLLESARTELLMNEIFWQQQSDGLALFMAPDLFQYYRLPLDFEEMVMAGDQFYIKPIFALFQDNGHFYILALSQDDVRLVEGTKYRVEELELDQVPASLAEALKWDEPEKQTQSHTVSRGHEGGDKGQPAMTFHGHGVGTDDEKTNILRYFQKIDKGLTDFLADQRVPLILAGVEYLFPIYREANSYNYLVEQNMPGNPEELSEETLHARAWELLEPDFQKAQREALASYREELGRQTGQASNNVAEIVPAAYAGRVAQLLVREKDTIWGRYDLAENRVDAHPDRRPESDDLLNTAAIYTFRNDGTIYILEEDEMPDQSRIAAIFRY